MSYNLGIVGSRYFNDYKSFEIAIDAIIEICGKPENIVSGGHLDKRGNAKRGADTLAYHYSVLNKIPIIEHEAKWDMYGRGAGPIRNKLIVNDSNVLVAFVSHDSVGTKNSIKLAKEKGISVHIFYI